MSAVPTTSPDIGLLLDQRYRIEEPIAHGGMATVHRGRDERLERTIALKVMHPHLATDPEFLRRFTREARSAARLSHPNVVSVFDQGEDQGLVYLAMELVEGETLRERLSREGRMTVGETLGIAEQVLEALVAAHRAGIVHRDVKPENILLAEDGRVKVADFGLARAVGTSTSSASGTLLGTVAYISPEVVTRGHCDERSDLYSFGVVLYEMLAGGQPYEGELPVHIAFQHVHEDIPAPSLRTPSVPSSLDALVTWACERSPASRPASAAQLLAAVRELRREIPIRVQQAVPLVAEERGTQDVPRLTSSLEDAVLESDAPARAFPGPDARIRVPVLEDDETDTQAAGSEQPEGPEGEDDAVDAARTLAIRPPRSRRGRHLARGARRTSALMRTAATISAVIALVAGAWAGVHWYGTAGPGGDRHVPVVAGTSLADAEAVLAQNDLGTRTREVFDESVPAGHVVSVSPGAGSVVKRDSDVVLTVSAGPRRFPVPDVRGRALEDARTDVGRAGLTLVEDDPAYDDKVPAGSIISQSADADALPEGGEVHVVVSRGPEPIAVPDVRGRSQADAEAALRAQGFLVTASQGHSPDVPAGAVISQDANGTARRGATIAILVSTGPEMVTVPDVFQQPEADAIAALQAAGFQVQVVHDKGQPVFGLVYEQSAAGGSQQAKGSTITIKVF